MKTTDEIIAEIDRRIKVYTQFDTIGGANMYDTAIQCFLFLKLWLDADDVKPSLGENIYHDEKR